MDGGEGDWSSSVEEAESFGGLGLGFLEKRLPALMKAKLGEDEEEEGFGGFRNQLSKKEPRLMDAIDGGVGGSRV